MSISKEDILNACSGDAPTLREILRRSEDLLPLENSTLAAKMLEVAAKSQNFETIQLVLSKYPNVDISEETVRNALASGSIDIYKALLSHDPSIVNLEMWEGRDSQLGWVLRFSPSPTFVDFLLTCGLNPNPDSPAIHPLCVANTRWQTQSLEICTALLKHGARLEYSGALASAAKYGKTDVVHYLLSMGANVNDNVTDPVAKNVWPPLHSAIESGNNVIAKMLIERGADPEALDGRKRNAFTVAHEASNKEMVDIMHGMITNQTFCNV